jgi:hypothetical protein
LYRTNVRLYQHDFSRWSEFIGEYRYFSMSPYYLTRRRTFIKADEYSSPMNAGVDYSRISYKLYTLTFTSTFVLIVLHRVPLLIPICQVFSDTLLIRTISEGQHDT